MFVEGMFRSPQADQSLRLPPEEIIDFWLNIEDLEPTGGGQTVLRLMLHTPHVVEIYLCNINVHGSRDSILSVDNLRFLPCLSCKYVFFGIR